MIVANRRNSVEECYLPIAVQSFESHKLDSLKLFTYTAKSSQIWNICCSSFAHVHPFAAQALLVIRRIVSTPISIDLYTISKKSGSEKKNEQKKRALRRQKMSSVLKLYIPLNYLRSIRICNGQNPLHLSQFLLLLQHVCTFLSVHLCRFFSRATIFHFKISHYSRIVFSQMLLYPNACEICCK